MVIVKFIFEIENSLKRDFKLYAIAHNTSMKKLMIDYIKTIVYSYDELKKNKEQELKDNVKEVNNTENVI